MDRLRNLQIQNNIGYDLGMTEKPNRRVLEDTHIANSPLSYYQYSEMKLKLRLPAQSNSSD